MTDNDWISDFHKALEERKEPKAEPDKPPQQEPASEHAKGLADWVKRMGGTLADDVRKVDRAVLDNGLASILRAQLVAADWPWRIIKNGS